MKNKTLITSILVTLFFLASLFAGCTPKTTPPQTTPPETTPDVTTTASIVDNADAFVKAISSTGTWIIATVKDVTIDKDIVLEGEFKNGKKDESGKDIVQRKIALYTQDENRNVTARFTLTAPKLTILSPEASIQHGIFKGDVYVSAKNFKLVDQKIEGNIYFTTDEAKSTFSQDATSSVTGKTELKK
ncbi:MAG: hypothetical protein K0R09_1708 [Clostridiales bacterium]|jgi:hypothetical protein|nr:hypothetical protein [Clostridiales bacterium]